MSEVYSSGLKEILSLALWPLAMLYFEIALRLGTKTPFKNPGLGNTLIWTVFYSAVPLALGLPAASSLGKAASGLLMLTLFFLYASQLVYYKIFKMFYTFYSMGNAGQVLDFIKDIAAYVAKSLHWILLLSVPPLVQLGFLHDLNLKFPETAFGRWSIVLAAMLILLLGKTRIQRGRHQLGSAYEAYHRSMDPTVTFRHFGLLTTMRLDFQRSILGLKSQIYDESRLKPSVYTVPEVWPPEAYNVLPLKLKGNLHPEQLPALNQLHDWVTRRKPTSKNAYTGRYEGYNLILITAESLSPYSIHPELTPTLYKMVHEGYFFPEFYNPIWGVSTSDGEYVACTGRLPKCGVWSFIESSGKSMAMTMGNQLRSKGYTTMAFHNHRYNYYKRDLSHPNMGYDYYGLGHGLDVTPCWPESDVEMMALSVPKFVDQTPFHAYYMTVSGHMRYSRRGNAMAAKHWDAVSHLSFGHEAKAYLATQIELDQAMALLLKQLEAAGIADRTLIAMSADHYPYGLSNKALKELAGHEPEQGFELYRSPFILYARGQTPEVIQRPCSSLDIVPTLLNLMGASYDARLLIGQDVFSDAPSQVIFLNKSFITDKGRYNAVTREYQPRTGIEDVEAITCDIEEKFLASARMLDLDYYSALDLNVQDQSHP